LLEIKYKFAAHLIFFSLSITFPLENPLQLPKKKMEIPLQIHDPNTTKVSIAEFHMWLQLQEGTMAAVLGGMNWSAWLAMA